MISADYSMVLKAVLFSFLLGSFFGAVYCFYSIARKDVWVRTSNKSKKRFFFLLLCLLVNIWDFVFFTTLGVFEFLLLYICTDGVGNIYSWLTLMLSFVLSKGVLKRIMTIVYNRLKDHFEHRKVYRNDVF